MNAIEALNIAVSNADKANSRPQKMEAEVKELRSAVIHLNKVIVAILKTLPEDQQNKIFEMYNSKEG